MNMALAIKITDGQYLWLVLPPRVKDGKPGIVV
jgi:hypothetical protein